MISSGLVSLNSELFSSQIIGIILSLFILAFGIYFLIGYFYGGYDCKNCDKKFNIDKSICVSCHSINTKTVKRKQNIYGSIALTLFGLVGITSLLTTDLISIIQYFDWTGYLISLCVGLYGISTNLLSAQYCTKCGNKNSEIPLNTPRAQELIKENNLTVPNEVTDQTKAPTT